jgi:hypothetical protein
VSNTLQFQTAIKVGSGPTYQQNRSVAANNQSASEPVGGIAAAKTGTLTTRTNNTTGTLTMSAGHGFNTGDKIALFWAGGSQRDVTLGTVSGNSVPFSGGTGDDLPAATTAITACEATVDAVAFTGDNAAAAVVYGQLPPADGDAYVEFTASDDSVIAAFQISGPNPTASWDGTGTNPFAGGAVAKVKFYQGAIAARVLGEVVVYN